MEKLNAIVIEGKVYEAVPEISPVSCAGCDLKNDDMGCPYAEVCYEWHSIFRYSQPLTDKLNDYGSKQKDTPASL